MAIGGTTRTGMLPAPASSVAKQGVTPSTATAADSSRAPGASTPAGTPAWNEDWHRKFRDAGAPSELLQQLMFTGAMGADATQLQASLDELSKIVNLEIAKFRDSHPEQYEKLAKSSSVDKVALVQVASAVNSGQVTDKQLADVVEQATAPSMGIKSMLLTNILPWTFIPGWGALRFAVAPLFGNKDPFSGDKIHYDFWNHGLNGWMDAAFAVGGAFSIANTVRGVQMVNRGTSLIKTAQEGSLVKQVIANEAASTGRTVADLTSWKRFLPGSTANRVVTGISHVPSMERHLAGLTHGSAAHTSLSNVLETLRRGEISIRSKSGFGMMPFGMGSDVRGALPGIGNRNKPMATWVTEHGRTILKLDGRIGTGTSMAAHVAGEGVKLLPGAGLVGTKELAALRSATLAEAGTAFGIARSGNPLAQIAGYLRPGATDDVLRAMRNPGAVAGGGMNSKLKLALLGIGAVGAGLLGTRMMQPKQAPADQQAPAGQQHPAGQQVAAPGSVESQPTVAETVAATGTLPGMSTEHAGIGAAVAQPSVAATQLTVDEQQLIANFQALSPQEQEQILTQAATEITAAAQSPNLTTEQQAAIAEQVRLFEMLAQVAAQSATPAAAG